MDKEIVSKRRRRLRDGVWNMRGLRPIERLALLLVVETARLNVHDGAELSYKKWCEVLEIGEATRDRLLYGLRQRGLLVVWRDPVDGRRRLWGVNLLEEEE